MVREAVGDALGVRKITPGRDFRDVPEHPECLRLHVTYQRRGGGPMFGIGQETPGGFVVP